MTNKFRTAEITPKLAEQDAAIEGLYLSAYPQKEIAEAKTLTRLSKSKAVYGAVACLDAEVIGFIVLLSSGECADILEICGAAGSLIGYFWNPHLYIFSTLGLAVLMLLGVYARVRVKQPLQRSIQALIFLFLNAFLFYKNI